MSKREPTPDEIRAAAITQINLGIAGARAALGPEVIPWGASAMVSRTLKITPIEAQKKTGAE